MLERVNEEAADRIDLYKLADDLNERLNHMLPVVEAAELLGFAAVDAGDLTLMPLGQAFAEASIQARKELFVSRTRRVPIIRWIRRMLDAAERHYLNRNVFEAALALEFPPDEAERQMETAINWGRYAELFSFDNDDNALFIEPESLVESEVETVQRA